MFRQSIILILICLSIFFSARIINAQSKAIIGHWEGVISREGKTWRTWLDVKQTGNSFQGTADFPDYGIYAFPILAYLDGEKAKISVLEGKEVASFDGKINGDEMNGNWKGLGMTATFQIKRAQANPLEPYVVEEVQFQNGDTILAGTLVRPNKSGQFPAIVFTHGSGNQTRSETFYRSRAYWFARNGIAALIYDRRGKGASKGVGNVTWENLADDALAGVQMLKTRSEINPKQIGVSGFSQGGWVSPVAATRSKDVAFILIGSAAAISPNEQNDYNVESVLRDKKVPSEKIEAVMKLRQRVSQFQLNGEGNKADLEKEIANLKTERWFRDTLLNEQIEQFDADTKAYMTFNPEPIWEKAKVPVLALWGEQDLAVPAKKSREIINLALEKGNAKTYDLREFPNAGHGISLNRGKNEAWDFPLLVSGYQELMVDWTKKMVARRN